MSFPSGSLSFRRYAVIGKHPAGIDQTMLDALAEHALKESELGVPEEEEYGWSAGRHILDRSFSFEHNVFAAALHFALRIDTNRFPSSLKKAYEAIEHLSTRSKRARPSSRVNYRQA